MNRIRVYQSASGEWIATRDDGTKIYAASAEQARADFIAQYGDDAPEPERPTRPARPQRAQA